MKDVKFCFAFVHDPGTFHARKKILLPTDIKGMKIRPATSTIGQMVTSLGGTNVQASAPESRDMLERGVADAITFPWGSIGLFGIDKVVSYHMDVPLYVTPFVWAMNQSKYDSMSPAQKKVIDDHCTSEWAEKVAGPWADFEFAGRAKIASQPGHEIYKLTPEQLDAWRKATAPVEAQWAEGVKKVGQDPKAVLDSLKANLAKQLGLVSLRASATDVFASPPPTGAWRTIMDRMINTIEWLAAMFVGIVALNIFVAVVLRKFFDTSIPDAYDFGRMLLGILIFWGIAATSYRGGHITVDLVWTAASPRMKRCDRHLCHRGAAVRGDGADRHAVRQGARHLRRPRADLRHEHPDLALLCGGLARRRLGGRADRDPHLPIDLPS